MHVKENSPAPKIILTHILITICQNSIHPSLQLTESNMSKIKAPKRKFNDSNPKSKSKANKPKSHKQTTPTASKTTTNTQSINNPTTTFLTLPRELRQQILYQTFTTHIEYEIS